MFSIIMWGVAVIATIQWITNARTRKHLKGGDWEDNQYKQACLILGHLTDQNNASNLYLVMMIYELIVIILAVILACDWGANGNAIELQLGLLLIISRISIFTSMICRAVHNWWTRHPHNPDEE